MPLLLPYLVSQLNQTFSLDNLTIQSASQNIAQAYFTYAQAGQGPNGEPIIFTGSETQILQKYLIQAFSQYSPATTAQLVGTGITAFWLMPPIFTSTGGVASTIITATGQAQLLSSSAKTRQQGAQNMASALHAMTQTLIFIENPPLASGPII
jgi:hypothetical protein